MNETGNGKGLGTLGHISRLHPFVRRFQSSELFMMFLDEYFEYITTRMSCGDLAAALTDHFGVLRGFSMRTVQQWCSEQGLECEVAKAIEEVCVVTWTQEIKAPPQPQSLSQKDQVVVQ